MVDAVSGSNNDVNAANTTVQKKEKAGTDAQTAMLKKAMDMQSNTMTQLFKSMGVGNNIDALA
jgi:hypothetical protein